MFQPGRLFRVRLLTSPANGRRLLVTGRNSKITIRQLFATSRHDNRQGESEYVIQTGSLFVELAAQADSSRVITPEGVSNIFAYRYDFGNWNGAELQLSGCTSTGAV